MSSNRSARMAPSRSLRPWLLLAITWACLSASCPSGHALPSGAATLGRARFAAAAAAAAGVRLRAQGAAGARRLLTRVRCEPPKVRSEMGLRDIPMAATGKAGKSQWDFGWRAVRCEEHAINVLMLVAGQTSPKQCLVGMAQDLKQGYSKAWVKLQQMGDTLQQHLASEHQRKTKEREQAAAAKAAAAESERAAGAFPAGSIGAGGNHRAYPRGAVGSSA